MRPHDDQTGFAWTDVSHKPKFVTGDAALTIRPNEPYELFWPIKVEQYEQQSSLYMSGALCGALRGALRACICCTRPHARLGTRMNLFVGNSQHAHVPGASVCPGTMCEGWQPRSIK